MGIALANKGDQDAAIKEYRGALTINPNYLQAHLNLGNALAIKGDLDGAIKEYNEALVINPSFVAAQNNLKIVLDKKLRFNKARK